MLGNIDILVIIGHLTSHAWCRTLEAALQATSNKELHEISWVVVPRRTPAF